MTAANTAANALAATPSQMAASMDVEASAPAMAAPTG
jgi:hypothetical protein